MMLKRFVERTILNEISNEPHHPAEAGDEERIDVGLPETFENLLRWMKRASREKRVTKENFDFFIAGLEKLMTRHNLTY